MKQITVAEAIQRTVEHREVFHDEMLHIMRQIMRGELTPAQIAGFIIGLRVKKETIGEIAAAAQVMREFATRVPVRVGWSMTCPRTSPSPNPKVKDSLRNPLRSAITCGSSAFNNANPSAGKDANNSPLARATPSRPPNPARWAWPMLVITPTVGRAISHSRVISPW